MGTELSHAVLDVREALTRVAHTVAALVLVEDAVLDIQGGRHPVISKPCVSAKT